MVGLPPLCKLLPAKVVDGELVFEVEYIISISGEHVIELFLDPLYDLKLLTLVHLELERAGLDVGLQVPSHQVARLLRILLVHELRVIV